MGWLPGDNRDLQTGKPDAPLVYYIFHCLSYKGKNCRNRALLERKKIIKKILPKGNLILKYAGHVGAPINYFSQVKKMGLEGMIAKRG